MDDAKKRARQIEHLKEWPIASIRPYKPPAFSGYSGPSPKQRFSANQRYRSPLAAFELFFDDSVFTLLLINTNDTGRRKHADWVDCDESAMRALIGTAIRMSKCPMLVLRDYWHKERGWDPVRTVWARNRFTRLWYALHVETSERPSDSASDRLWDIKPLSELLNRNYAAALQPPGHLTVDETMIASRCKHPAFQLMPGKPISRGFKMWTLADASGYVYKQSLYCGGSDEGSPAGGITKEIVLELMNDYFGVYRTVYFDSAFTSVELLLELWAKKTMAVGKVHPVRRFPLHVRKAVIENDQFLHCQHSECPALSATACRTLKRRAELLSTALPLPMATVELSPACSDRSFPAPEVLAEYNQNCGGVDLANRLVAQTTLHRKHYRSHMTFVEHFINVAMANAWVVYDQWARHRPGGLPIATFHEFAWKLSDELVGTFVGRERVGRPPSTSAATHQHVKAKDIESEENTRKRCAICNDRSGGGDFSHKTVWRCTCGVVVCETNPNCWPQHLKDVRAVAE